jgi:low temperature requirement protein LtrA
MELFFDLVYVFAVTQLSEHLGEHVGAHRGAQTLVLFLAVWWAWNYTAWATNWIDPERWPVALLMLVLMALSLVMSAAIPAAFGSRGLTFALAYVSIQVLRSAFMVLAFGRQTMGANYAQLLAWSAIAGVAWIAGALVHGDARLLVWLGALALDLAAPMHGFRLPGRAATPIEQWTLAGAHLAERMQLVLLIALGESVLRVGATFAAQPARAVVLAAFVLGFAGTASLWAVYFLRHAEQGAAAISRTVADAARLGRTAYAYAHAIMVAGVIVVAIAIRLTIEGPTATVSSAVAAVTLGGPGLYLAGVALFKRSVGHGNPRPPLLGVACLAALAPVALIASRVELACLATIVLVALAVAAGRAGEAQEAGEHG